MNGFTAFIDARDKFTSRYTMIRQSYGDTPDEALLMLAEILKEKHGNETQM